MADHYAALAPRVIPVLCPREFPPVLLLATVKVDRLSSQKNRQGKQNVVPLPRSASPSARTSSSPGSGPEENVTGRALDFQVSDLSEFEPQERSELVSRVVNVLLAVVILICVSPVMLLTAMLIRLTSRGPVLYTQTRVGIDRRWNRTRALHERRREDLGGVPFEIYKFRSMRVDAEVNGQAVWARKNDDRVTALGRI
ncbi:MAG: sugar transferase, partial [Gemmatimonadaceae bacterium]|nr:sugar transferase [Gemmatimonadaceae bacterium]